MNKSLVNKMAQVLAIALSGIALFLIFDILAQGKTQNEGIESQAIQLLASGRSILSVEAIEHAYIKRIFYLTDSQRIYEIQDQQGINRISILVRVDQNRVYRDYLILSVHNPLQNWENSNSLIQSQWKNNISKLIAIAEDFQR